MLMCFKLLLWPAAQHLSRATLALAWTPVLARFLNLSYDSALLVLTDHQHIQLRAPESPPAPKDRELLIACLKGQ